MKKYRFGAGLNLCLIMPALVGCASARSVLGISSKETFKPIDNPFSDYQPYSSKSKDPSTKSMVLRTRKGDRAVEIEIPGDTDQLSEFVLPVSPAFSPKASAPSPAGFEGGRGIASIPSSGAGIDSTDFDSGEMKGSEDLFTNHPPTFSDREIIQTFPQLLPEETDRRLRIEQDLHLAPSIDNPVLGDKYSYLSRLDYIKRLYKQGRFEAALVATDELIKQYSTAPKLHEMRGTLLDHLGRRELALKSWNQALRFNPGNIQLKKFLERKQASVSAP